MDDREQAITAAKQRMANFRLRQAPTTTTMSTAPPAKSHARSHSRNNSIATFPSTNNASTTDEAAENPGPVPDSPSPRSRPHSHHRRRSSVSTRRESAEMMGVAPPPESTADTAGDPSELRRLALWTLEGKGHSNNAFIGGFTKVEIPELNTPDFEGNFESIQVPKTKAMPLPAFGMPNSLAGKRDSFGKLLMTSSNSLKDQLHTLVEEEEEEESEEKAAPPSVADDSFREECPYTRPSAPTPNRHRPTNLTLRPLSLTPDALPMTRSDPHSLPTPSPTPSPRIGGLKSLTLTPSPSPVPSSASASSVSSVPSRRQSMSASPSPQPLGHVQRHQSLGGVPSPPPSAPTRKSSISYKRTHSGEQSYSHLPTPGPTPTSPMPPLHTALPATSTELERPLSPTEQAFLFRSHASLLCRISDLEKAISGGRGRLPPGAGVGLDAGTGFGMEELRDRSTSHERPTSTMSMSAVSEPESLASLSSQPSDEMLQLVSDLKAERDELMRDAEGWRMRTADLEKQVATLTRRVEAERREGWVIRERLGLVEVEKRRVREEAERVRLECRKLEKSVSVEEEARATLEGERDVLGSMLEEERARRDMAERDVEILRGETEQLRARADQADSDLQALLATPRVGLQILASSTLKQPRFNSVDSGTSSMTDVEEYVPVALQNLKLKAVEEEDEERDLPRDVTSEDGSDAESDNDELAHYEDDEEMDDELIFSDDQTSSSFGSVARSNSHLLRLDLAAVAPAPAPIVPPTHGKTGSIEKGWSFPHSGAQAAPTKKDACKVDRFFECLDGLDENYAEAEAGGLATYDGATAKQFWRGAMQGADDDDEMPPFVLPAQPSPTRKGTEWKEIEAAKLEVVAEEETEEGLISFPSFSWPARGRSALDNMDVSKVDPVTPRPNPAARKSVLVDTPTKPQKLRRTSKDLTIPGFKPYSGSVPVLKAPPPPKRTNSPAKVPPTTPTSKNTPESASLSLIPQPSYSPPSSNSTLTPPKPRGVTTGPTFIPRPSNSPKSTSMKPTTASARKLTPPAKPLTTSTPVFTPQPKMTSKPVTRSSSLPPPPPLLTRLSNPLQQTAAPATSALAQGLTARLTSLTSFWSPWSTVPHAAESGFEPAVRGFVSKEDQLERLRVRLESEGALAASWPACASCKDGTIAI